MPSWPEREAKKILQHLNGNEIVLQTGFGATGLPHIGTFGEIVRTLMIKKALNDITDIPVKVISFSDDLDTLRKIPSNIPNQELMKQYLNKPVTMIPDPNNICQSFGHYNNSIMKQFINRYNFDVEFISSYESYLSGRFNHLLLLILKHRKEIFDIILPTFGAERRKTYSPFIPILEDGTAITEGVVDYTEDSVIVKYNNSEIAVPVINGRCKLQWKIDWAMRWCAFNVNYEMHGIDLVDSYNVSAQICKILGHHAPQHMAYEMFVSEDRTKISKSKGNGLSLEQWSKYTSPEIIKYYMYQKPETSKRLCLDVIPRETDNYIKDIQTNHPRLKYIHLDGKIPYIKTFDLSYSMLLNIVNACNAEHDYIMFEFIDKYIKLNDQEMPFWKVLINGVINYYNDYIKPNKEYKIPTENEKILLRELHDALLKTEDIESIKNIVYEIGKKYIDLRQWFQMIYQVLLGQNSGPRLYSFITLYGVKRFCMLLDEKIKLHYH